MKIVPKTAPGSVVRTRFVSVVGFIFGALFLLFVLNTWGGNGRIRQDIWFTPLAGQGAGHTADLPRFLFHSHTPFEQKAIVSVYETPVRVEDRAYFQGVIKRWGVPYLVPAISTTDEDFTDIWHLRKSRASEFTQSLTREFLVHFVLPAMRAAPTPMTDSVSNSDE